MQNLTDRVVVITGSGSGIGRSLCHAFGEAGARIVLADVDVDAMSETQRELDASIETLTVRTDITQAAEVDALARAAVATFGRVDVLCNNAGVVCTGFIWEHTLEDWDWLMAINVRGVVNGLRTFVPIFLEQGSDAHIVNTSSMLGLTGAPLNGPYAASKHAVVGISDVLRADLGLKGARVGVSVLCPGPVATRIYDAGGHPEMAAEVDPAVVAVSDTMKKIVDDGMDPRAVADCVVDAVRNDRFWVFPAPEFIEGTLNRADDVRAAVDEAKARAPGARSRSQ